MPEDPEAELGYLALQVRTARDQYRSAVRARNRFMRQLDGEHQQATIAKWAEMSEPQALRILSNVGGASDEPT